MNLTYHKLVFDLLTPENGFWGQWLLPDKRSHVTTVDQKDANTNTKQQP